jgi:hypothetical protein
MHLFQGGDNLIVQGLLVGELLFDRIEFGAQLVDVRRLVGDLFLEIVDSLTELCDRVIGEG